MKTTKTRKLSNKGTFQERIIENVNNGWKYKSTLVKSTASAGKYGNLSIYHFYDSDTNTFKHVGTIPSWASRNGKYKNVFANVFSFTTFPENTLQEFITNRK